MHLSAEMRRVFRLRSGGGLQLLLMYLSQAVNAIFPLLVAPLIVRKAGLPVFGAYSLMLVAAQAALLVSEYSFDAVGPRLLAGSGDESGRKGIGQAVLRNKLSLLPAAAGVWLIGSLIVGITPTLPGFAGALLILLGTALQGNWYLIATNRAKDVAIFNLTGRLVALVLIVAMLAASLSADWLLLATGAGTFVAGAVVSARTLGVRFHGVLTPSMSLLGKGRNAFFATAGSSLQNLVGVSLAGMLGGTSGAGSYAATDRIARSASGALKPFFLTIYPRMARMHLEAPEKANRTAFLLAFGWFAIAIPLVLSTHFLGGRVLVLLYGQSIQGATHVLTILVGWLSFGVANNFLGIQGLLAGGRDRQYLRAIWSGLATTGAGAAACVLFHRPVVDAAWSVLAGEAVVFLALLLQFWKLR